VANFARPPITPTLVSALSRPSQTTLTALLVEYNWSDKNVLEALSDLASIMAAWSIECVPPIGEFGLDDVRILRGIVEVDPLDQVLADIARGEGSNVEFKESLVLDVKRHVLGKQPIAKCFSAEVLHSALKTIAAYLNGAGGTLLVGVGDDGAIVGLEREFQLIPNATKKDFDEWELYLRTMLEKYFHNGRSITSSVQISRACHENGSVARLIVGARRELCIMKTEEGDRVYIRAGNRTLSVTLADIEQYFVLEKRYL